MGLRPTKPATNGHAKRRLASWIESFVEYTVDLESPENFRRWVAIATIAAVLEQKVYCEAGQGVIYPNLYTWLIAHPGVGKSNAIKTARKFIEQLPDPFIVPTSVTSASLTDFMVSAKRTVVRFPDPMVEYHSAIMMPDELSAFMSEWDKQMIGLLTTMYDVDVPYGENRRTSGIKHKISRPQINMIVGTTPSNLMKYVPEHAWDQGFTSRIILVYGEARPDVRDPFNITTRMSADEIFADLELINTIGGKFTVDPLFKERLFEWRSGGYTPVPSHPRLNHYITRRWAHTLKLCMVSSVDRGDSLTLTVEDFDRATGWLIAAEALMPSIFEEGIVHADTASQNELLYWIAAHNGKPFRQDQLLRKARTLMSIYAIERTVIMFENAGLLVKVSQDPKTMLWTYRGG